MLDGPPRGGKREEKVLSLGFSVFQRRNGRWGQDHSRTYVGEEETARTRVAEVRKFSPHWKATPNLPEENE